MKNKKIKSLSCGRLPVQEATRRLSTGTVLTSLMTPHIREHFALAAPPPPLTSCSGLADDTCGDCKAQAE